MEIETESQPPAKRKKVQKKLTTFFSTNASIHSENKQLTELSEPSSTSIRGAVCCIIQICVCEYRKARNTCEMHPT